MKISPTEQVGEAGIKSKALAYKNQARHQAFSLLWNSDMMATRFTLAIASLTWSVLLALPSELFTPSRVTYHLMAQMASENTWAAAFGLQGIVMMAAIFFQLKNRFIWLADAFLGCLLWTATTIACFAVYWKPGVPYAPPAAMSADVALFLASWWHLVRSSAEK